jgi:hypothetical protein
VRGEGRAPLSLALSDQLNRNSSVRHQNSADLTLGAAYGIAAHVYVCVTGDGSVILDANRDKYLGLGREETEVLAQAVAGWPTPLWAPDLESMRTFGRRWGVGENFGRQSGAHGCGFTRHAG